MGVLIEAFLVPLARWGAHVSGAFGVYAFLTLIPAALSWHVEKRCGNPPCEFVEEGFGCLLVDDVAYGVMLRHASAWCAVPWRCFALRRVPLRGNLSIIKTMHKNYIIALPGFPAGRAQMLQSLPACGRQLSESEVRH